MPHSPFHSTHSHTLGPTSSCNTTTSCHRCKHPVHTEYFPPRAPNRCDTWEILAAAASVNTPINDEVFKKTPGIEFPSGSSLSINPDKFKGRPAITRSSFKIPPPDDSEEHNKRGPSKVAYPIQLLLLATFKGSTQEALPTVLQHFCIPIFFNKPIIKRSTWLIARQFNFVGHINRWWRNINKSKSHSVSSFCLEPVYHTAFVAEAKLLWEQWVAECQENEGFAQACLLDYQNKMREARRKSAEPTGQSSGNSNSDAFRPVATATTFVVPGVAISTPTTTSQPRQGGTSAPTAGGASTPGSGSNIPKTSTGPSSPNPQPLTYSEIARRGLSQGGQRPAAATRPWREQVATHLHNATGTGSPTGRGPARPRRQ
ncbi:hypothetical protein C8Q74DRAFT_394722 [Fomes fomentarius]|nr:hypothetical protein C8Q74DRAFT_394722 [Fomes fomentarius]